MIRNMSIGQRLAVGFGVVIALLVLLAGLSYVRIASLNKEMDTLVKVRYANTVAANRIKEDVSEATRSMLNVLIMTDPDQIKKELANTEARSASATAEVAELAKSTGDAEAADILKALATIQNKFLPAQTAFIKLVNDDKKDVYGEMRGCGFDVKAAKTIIHLRRKDAAERQEEEAILDLYKAALGMDSLPFTGGRK